MAVRATCPVCGVSLFSPSDAFTSEAILDRHQRSGRCDVSRPSRQAQRQVDRSTLTDDEAPLGSRTGGAAGGAGSAGARRADIRAR